MKISKESKALDFTLLIRDNKTNKHCSFRVGDESIKSKEELLDLIVKLLKEKKWKLKKLT